MKQLLVHPDRSQGLAALACGEQRRAACSEQCRAAARSLFLLFLACLPFAISGCTPAGIVAYELMGDAPVDAEYPLPRVTTLVLVENYPDVDTSQEDADVLANYIVEDLKRHLNNKKKEEEKKEIPMKFVDPQKLYDLRTADSEKFHHMKIQEIGRELGAKQVVYVSMDDVGVQSMGSAEMMRGTGQVRVKVVNCVTGQTLWPQEASGGYPVSLESKLITPQENITYDQARDKTFRTMALNIAELFYKYNPANTDTDDNDFSTSD